MSVRNLVSFATLYRPNHGPASELQAEHKDWASRHLGNVFYSTPNKVPPGCYFDSCLSFMRHSDIIAVFGDPKHSWHRWASSSSFFYLNPAQTTLGFCLGDDLKLDLSFKASDLVLRTLFFGCSSLGYSLVEDLDLLGFSWISPLSSNALQTSDLFLGKSYRNQHFPYCCSILLSNG